MNKKLFKIAICGIPVILGCITACSAISSIKTNDTTQDVVPSNALPYEVYEIDESNVLLGFKAGIDLDQYHDGIVNTMEIPSKVTSIDAAAFFENAKSTIPSFIKNLTFAENSKCSSIDYNAFNQCSLTSVNLSNCTSLKTISTYVFFQSLSLTSVSFPSSLTEIQEAAFKYCSKLNYIAWDLPDDYQTSISIGYYAFWDINSVGSVESFNPSISSQDLLDWIKGKGNFPSSGWTIAC